MLSRRGLITGLISFVAAPAIVRFESIMPVKAIPRIYHPTMAVTGWGPSAGWAGHYITKEMQERFNRELIEMSMGKRII